MTILLTGFDPFGGETTNPSWEAVRALDGATIRGRRVIATQLPTAFGAAGRELVAAIGRHAPKLVLCVGQAGGRAAICFERVALNLVDARIADNAGAQPLDVPVVEGAPAAYFAALPVKAMAAAVRAAGIPAEVSLSAGSFVCNAVFFALAHHIATQAPKLRGGFAHVPYSPEQVRARAGAPSMPIDRVSAALAIALEVALARRRDLAASEGSIA